jgi:TRAP-type C4-dicarboxylate transport system permease small subunit
MSGPTRSAVLGLGAVCRVLEAGAMALSILLLLVLLVIMNVEVVARYLLNSSTLIADEYGGYLYTWIVLLGAVHLLRSDRYLTMTSVIDRLSRRMRNFFGVFGALIGLVVSAIGLYTTWVLVRNSYFFGTRSIQPSATPLVIVQSILPLGFGLLCLAYVEEILRRCAGLRPRRADDDPDTYGIGEL